MMSVIQWTPEMALAATMKTVKAIRIFDSHFLLQPIDGGKANGRSFRADGLNIDCTDQRRPKDEGRQPHPGQFCFFILRSLLCLYWAFAWIQYRKEISKMQETTGYIGDTLRIRVF